MGLKTLSQWRSETSLTIQNRVGLKRLTDEKFKGGITSSLSELSMRIGKSDQRADSRRCQQSLLFLGPFYGVFP
jgi:hypothetical protein